MPIVVSVAVLMVGCTGQRQEGPGRSADSPPASSPSAGPEVREFQVPARTRPHDVAPAADGGVWYTAQGSGELGHLDPTTGATRHVPLGRGSAPHGVVVGPDGAPWITDGGLNAIVRVDPATGQVRTFPLPDAGKANLNTATFDGQGTLWFTGQNGVYGRLDPRTGKVEVLEAPRGTGPYGISTTPDGAAWYSSLAGSYIARIGGPGRVEVLDVPTAGGGARRIWSDSSGRLWTTEWFAGKLARFDPQRREWKEWTLPGSRPQPYAVFVDDRDTVWISDFGSNAFVSFEPATETFRQFPLGLQGANVRQILGRPGEVWGAASGAAHLVVVKTR